jgi:hypothetical protein
MSVSTTNTTPNITTKHLFARSELKVGKEGLSMKPLSKLLLLPGLQRRPLLNQIGYNDGFVAGIIFLGELGSRDRYRGKL